MLELPVSYRHGRPAPQTSCEGRCLPPDDSILIYDVFFEGKSPSASPDGLIAGVRVQALSLNLVFRAVRAHHHK